MVTKVKHGGETQAVVQALDEKIANLTQMRTILADPGMLAIIKEIVGNPSSSIRAETQSPNMSTRQRGIVDAAFECVEEIGDEFTKWDLAEKLRQRGYQIRNPKNGMYYPIQCLLIDGRIEQVKQGGGNRPNTYRRINSTESGRSMQRKHSEETAIEGSIAVVPAKLRPRKMERIAVQCIAEFDQPFEPHQLINAMRAVGFIFVANADVSIQSCLRRLVTEGVIEIVQEGDGRRPASYRSLKPVQPERK
jgi:hypothetical protein